MFFQFSLDFLFAGLVDSLIIYGELIINDFE